MGDFCFPGVAGKTICVPGPDPKRPPDPQPSRLLLLTPEQAFGQQVVGSIHDRSIALPFMSTSKRGTATVFAAVTKGHEAFETDWSVTTIEPSTALEEVKRHFDEAIHVKFAPLRTGAFRGELTVSVAWADGHIERQVIELTGSAYPLDRLPAWPEAKKSGGAKGPEPQDPDAPEPIPDLDGAQYNAPLELATKDAEAHLGAMVSAMRRGMNETKDTAGTFRPRHEDDSMWIALAKFALSTAIGAIASPIATYMATRFLNVLTLELRGEVADEGFVKSVAKLVEKPVKAIGDATLGQVIGGARQTVKGEGTDAVASFFAGQMAAIDKLETVNKLGLNARWAELLTLAGSQPRLAAAAMRALGKTFEHHADVAGTAQAVATASAWSTFKVRDSLGAEQVTTDHGEKTVTDLTSARDWGDKGLVSPARTNGLLEIEIDIHGGAVKVLGARIDGIAQGVADRLIALDLRRARMPLRINVNDAGAFLTVDEVGRVRASGALILFSDDGLPTVEEARVHDGAQRVADLVLSRTLEGWGIARIVTNDASPRRVQP